MQYPSREINLAAGEQNTQQHVVASWLKTSAAALMLSSALLPGISQAVASQGPGMPPDAPPAHHQNCHTPEGGPRGFQGGLGMMLRGLNLTDAQESQIFTLRHAQEPKLHENEQTIRQNMRALTEMSRSRSFDASKAEALSQALGQAVASNAVLRAQTDQQIYQLLTSEQKKTLEERRKRFESGTRP